MAEYEFGRGTLSFGGKTYPVTMARLTLTDRPIPRYVFEPISWSGMVTPESASILGDMLRETAEHHVRQLVAVTERWCWKAIARGIGNRVWRSNPITEEWPNMGASYQFQILAPGERAPGSGVVFGPFSKG